MAVGASTTAGGAAAIKKPRFSNGTMCMALATHQNGASAKNEKLTGKTKKFLSIGVSYRYQLFLKGYFKNEERRTGRGIETKEQFTPARWAVRGSADALADAHPKGSGPLTAAMAITARGSDLSLTPSVSFPKGVSVTPGSEENTKVASMATSVKPPVKRVFTMKSNYNYAVNGKAGNGGADRVSLAAAVDAAGTRVPTQPGDDSFWDIESRYDTELGGEIAGLRKCPTSEDLSFGDGDTGPVD